MKNNNSKLKWWQKGALVGLGLGAGAAFLTKMSGGYLGFVNLPVLPFYFLIYKYLENIIDPSSGWALIVVSLVYFISWILVGIVLAGIFHIIRRIENKFTKSR